MRILFASAEFAPLAQSGGLGDAVAGLAGALRARGHEIECVVPAYPSLLRHPECPKLTRGDTLELRGPAGPFAARWSCGDLESGVRLALVDAPETFEGEAIYPPDSHGPLRYASLGRAAALRAFTTRPDVLVTHDWHAALGIAVLRTIFDTGPARAIGTVQVVHNNAYQGRFPPDSWPQLGLHPDLFRPDGLECFGDLCLLKGGLLWAERIVAVSPRYARELTTPEFGNGLEGVYRMREHRLSGIVNGIDVGRYGPEHDEALSARFSAAQPAGRARCREALLSGFGLDTPEPGRLLVAVGRFAEQKGWDVLAEALDALVARGSSVVLLGDGDAAISKALERAAARHPGRIAIEVGWNEALARRMYAAADCVLIPSRFEPCGLVQRIAQRYGALPVAHRVGGIVDTVEDGKSGVLFEPLDPRTLVAAADRAAGIVAARGREAVARALMAVDVSWTGPAADWESLLEAVGDEARGRA